MRYPSLALTLCAGAILGVAGIASASDGPTCEEAFQACDPELATCEEDAVDLAHELCVCLDAIEACEQDLQKCAAPCQQSLSVCTIERDACLDAVEVCEAQLGPAKVSAQQCAMDLATCGVQLDACELDRDKEKARADAFLGLLDQCQGELAEASGELIRVGQELAVSQEQLSRCQDELGEAELELLACEEAREGFRAAWVWASHDLAICGANLTNAQGAVADLTEQVELLVAQTEILEADKEALAAALEAALAGLPSDADGDGVFDDFDRCPDTPEGAEVDQEGCSIGQFCARFGTNAHCAAADWKNDNLGFGPPRDCVGRVAPSVGFHCVPAD